MTHRTPWRTLASLLGLLVLALALVACDEGIPLTVIVPTTATPTDAAPAQAALPDDAADDVVTAEPAIVATPTLSPAPARLVTTPTPRPDVPGAVGRVVIPCLGLDAPIVAVSWALTVVEGQTVGQWPVPQDAVGHHRDSVAPGEPGNCVLSGHSSAEQGGVFYGLWDLQRGDEIRVSIGDTQATYRVETVDILPEVGRSLAQRRQHAQAMAQTADARLTLITCWPDWAYTHRVIVVARPLS
jgi:sortase A